jgi:hypothetical protein
VSLDLDLGLGLGLGLVPVLDRLIHLDTEYHNEGIAFLKIS